MKLRLPAICLILLLVISLAHPSHLRAQRTIAARLMEIAEESLTVQYHTLVNGDIDAALAGRRSADSYRESRMSRLREQKNTRDILKRRNLDFKAFKTRLIFKSLDVEGDKAILSATEATELNWRAHDLTTKLSDDHLFTFALAQGQWKLLTDEIVFPASQPSDQRTAVSPGAPSDLNAKSEPLQVALRRRFSHHASKTLSPVAPTGFYNANDAVDYAIAHAAAGTSNPDYKRFNNDCTNFASQSLFAGGWVQALGFYTNNNNWFYACENPITGSGTGTISYSWGAAYNLWDFLRNYSGRGTELATTSTDADVQEEQLFPGDLVFCDWDRPDGQHVPDGRVDHVTIVTAKFTSGDILLSYHTTDTLNISMPLLFDRIHSQNRHVQFHAFKLKANY
jgi:Putative amidase domain